MEADITSQAVGLASNTDFSITTLFLRADIIVKSVIIILIASSIYSWAIIFEKIKLFKKINKSTDEFENKFWKSKSAESFYNSLPPNINEIKLFKKINKSTDEFENKFWKSKSAESFYNSLPPNINDPMANLFKDSMQVLLKSKRSSSLDEKMSRMLEINVEQQMEKIDKSYTFLATVGSTAPFIGLFGTVWGIMNSFQSIAISRNTSLAIVAPGIAEALFATALGLLAAIPAVVAYNKFSSDSKKYSQKLENFSKKFLSII